MKTGLKSFNRETNFLIYVLLAYLVYRFIYLAIGLHSLGWSNSFYIIEILFIVLISIMLSKHGVRNSIEMLCINYTILVASFLFIHFLIAYLFDIWTSSISMRVIAAILGIITIAFSILVYRLKKHNIQIIGEQVQPNLLKQYHWLKKPLYYSDHLGSSPKIISNIIILIMSHCFVMIIFILITSVQQLMSYYILRLIQLVFMIGLVWMLKKPGTRHILEVIYIKYSIFFNVFMYSLLLVFINFNTETNRTQFYSLASLIGIFLTIITVGFIILTALYKPASKNHL